MKLNSDIGEIKGVGEKSSEAFHKMNIHTVNDLINYYPRTYEEFEQLTVIKDIVINERNAVWGRIIANAKMVRFSGKSMVTAYVNDENGDTLEIKFFNAPFLLKTLKQGTEYVFRGYVKNVSGRLVMSQPKMYKASEYEKLMGTIGPIYSTPKDITSSKIQKSIEKVLPLCDEYSEYLSDEEINKQKLLSIKDSLKNIHFPTDNEMLYKARRRLVFEEFLEFYHSFRNDENSSARLINDEPFIETADAKLFEQALPFSLTAAQKKVIDEIINDITGPYLMNRLVQGDVGSGKTIVAVMALLTAASNNAQGALMAPTEVLAIQHYNTIKGYCDKYGLCMKPVLLYGKMPKKMRDENIRLIKSGEANVVIGTHALFQEAVEFRNLKLVVTDEQHRFGVNQREALRDKGVNPHILVMSATPIPRTLAMVMYGNADISIMNELPKNRIPINNCVVNSSFQKKSFDFIKAEIDKGHQAYVICPMIDESEEDNINLKNVIDFTEELRDYYKESVSVCCLHGKMKSDEKNRIMNDFKDGKFDILVSTTVIEVGVDVPNATVIMIENAERFGLSQLHQLRGRVGRSANQSYCIMVSDTKSEDSIKRLKVLNETNDGFLIAKKDIELRGPGELNGIRQSGALSFSLGDIVNDADIFMSVIDIYDEIKERLNSREFSKVDLRTI